MPRMSYETIQKQIQKLQLQAKKLEASHQTKKRKGVEQIQALMKKLNISLGDLNELSKTESPKANRERSPANRTRSVKRTSHPPVAPKYRNPETMETWTGRGKQPRWLASLVAQGYSKEHYLISNSIPESGDATQSNTATAGESSVR